MTTCVSRYAGEVLSPGVVGCSRPEAQEVFDHWMKNTVRQVTSIQDVVAPTSSSGGCSSAPTDGCCQTKTEEKEELEYDSDDEEQDEPEVMDLEDVGDPTMADKTTSEVREMVT